MHTGTVYTGQKKALQVCRERRKRSGVGKVRQERRLEERTKGGELFTHYAIPDRSGGQRGREFRRGRALKEQQKNGEELGLKKTDEMSCKRSSLQNTLNNSSSQVARGQPQEQSLR